MLSLTKPVPTKKDEAHLFYREGSSDKEYHVNIEPKGDLFVVNFAYGRRGSTLQTGTKTNQPVDYATARKIFDKLVQEKTAKGYTPAENGTPYQHTEKASQATGILPQLLNPIEEGQLDQFINNSQHWAQEKYDGKRMLIQKDSLGCRAINRKGLIVGIPLGISQNAENIASDFIIDGESVGDVLYAFDLLCHDAKPVGHLAYFERYLRLMNLLASAQTPNIHLVYSACTPEEKKKLFERLRREKKEGIVFKRLDAPYVPGRPASGGSQLKYKFYATASFIVGKINAKRSISLHLLSGRVPFLCGNVTIPPNKPVPSVGEVVEVRYLYAYRHSNHAYQPVYLGQRDDIDPAQCKLGQLKYKSGDEEDEP